MLASRPRELLIDTAISLFSERGYHATGIDMIVKKSGVSKKTMYRHFRSKEELILAALRKYEGIARNNFMHQVEEMADSPVDRLLTIFDVAENWFRRDDFFGCMYINAIGEFSDPDSPIRRVCKEYKSMFRGYIHELCVQQKAADPADLADKLALLYEGATVTAQVSQDGSRAAQVAKAVAKTLIEQAVSRAQSIGCEIDATTASKNQVA